MAGTETPFLFAIHVTDEGVLDWHNNRADAEETARSFAEDFPGQRVEVLEVVRTFCTHTTVKTKKYRD